MALKRRERWLLATPLVLVAAFSFYTYVHQPLFTALARTRQNLQAAHAQLARDTVRLKKEGDLAGRELILVQRQLALAEAVGGSRSQAVLVYRLARAEHETGVAVREITLTPGKPDGGLLPVTIAMQAEGTFLSHVLFNQALEEIPVFLAGDRLALERRYPAPDRQGTAGARAPSAPSLASLAVAPPVLGSYRLLLYLRTDATGPDTSDQSFPDVLGRFDPFAEASSDALHAELQAAFPGVGVKLSPPQPGPLSAPPPPAAHPTLPDGRPAPQLG